MDGKFFHSVMLLFGGGGVRSEGPWSWVSGQMVIKVDQVGWSMAGEMSGDQVVHGWGGRFTVIGRHKSGVTGGS